MSGGFCDPYVFSSLPAWDTEGYSGAQTSIICPRPGVFSSGWEALTTIFVSAHLRAGLTGILRMLPWVLGPELWLS